MYINEISKKLKMSKKAINLYEEKGLIKPCKDHKGYRVYDECEYKLKIIQQLRQFDFSIAEIKDILIKHDYQVFEQKKELYQKQAYRIDTSLQYLDTLKECIINEQDIEDISSEINEIFDLENETVENNFSIDLDKLYFEMMSVAAILAFWSYKNILIEILAVFLFLSAIFLRSNVQIRLYFYELYKKFLK